jgi:hypothetical protein
MQAKIVFFIAGSGGNFLNRVLTLDTRTVPLGGYDSIGNYLSVEQRAHRYHYDRIIEVIGNKFNKINSGNLTDWVKIELEKMYFPLTVGMEKLILLDQIVVEMIHPHHWHEKKELFGPDDDLELFYLDVKDCKPWVASQRLHKVLENGCLDTVLEKVHQDQAYMLDLIKDLKVKPVYLKNILDSTHSFMQEYARICDLLKLNCYPDLALSIYQSWQSTWSNHVGSNYRSG